MIYLVSFLLAMQPYRYCIDHITPAGLALDRASDRNTVSVAASGFAMVNWALLLEREDALRRIHQCLTQTLKYNPPRNRGWLYHFTDQDGRPKDYSEVSTIDTAIWMAGAGKAASLLDDPELARRVESIKASIDVEWMRNGPYIRHGFHWRGDEMVPIPCFWDSTFSEGALLYDVFDLEYSPTKIRPDLPLFVFYYPIVFKPRPEYFDYLRRAVEHQKQTLRHWGTTACDGPDGYQVNRPDIISPLAIATIQNFVPDAAEYLRNLPVTPTTPAYQPSTGWTAQDRIGIDDMVYVALQHRRMR
jgi:hypothetical protein